MLRNRINRPTNWMDTMNVKYRNARTIVEGAVTTEPVVVTGTRGTAYGTSDFTITQDTLTISTKKIVNIFIDRADLAQQSYVDGMKMGEMQGKLISEHLESAVLAQFASWTDFGVTDLSNTGDDDSSQITVSATNIDDIIRAIKRKIYANNGVEFATEKGMFIVWRASDFELLEGFVQANGFTEADIALKNGIPVQRGFYYGGVTHYLSNSHTANHVFAGVKGMGDLGILSGTFGQVVFVEDPLGKSGVGVVSRVDYGFSWPTYYAEYFMDVNVA